MRDTVVVAKNVIVPKPQKTKIILAQKSVACGLEMLTSWHVVLATINTSITTRAE